MWEKWRKNISTIEMAQTTTTNTTNINGNEEKQHRWNTHRKDLWKNIERNRQHLAYTQQNRAHTQNKQNNVEHFIYFIFIFASFRTLFFFIDCWRCVFCCYYLPLVAVALGLHCFCVLCEWVCYRRQFKLFSLLCMSISSSSACKLLKR